MKEALEMIARANALLLEAERTLLKNVGRGVGDYDVEQVRDVRVDSELMHERLSESFKNSM